MSRVVIRTADGEVFEPEEVVALKSISVEKGRSLMAKLTSPGDPDYEILISASRKNYAKVIEYCQKHLEAPGSDLRSWDARFVRVDPPILVELLKGDEQDGLDIFDGSFLQEVLLDEDLILPLDIVEKIAKKAYLKSSLFRMTTVCRDWEGIARAELARKEACLELDPNDISILLDRASLSTADYRAFLWRARLINRAFKQQVDDRL